MSDKNTDLLRTVSQRLSESTTNVQATNFVFDSESVHILHGMAVHLESTWLLKPLSQR